MGTWSTPSSSTASPPCLWSSLSPLRRDSTTSVRQQGPSLTERMPASHTLCVLSSQGQYFQSLRGSAILHWLLMSTLEFVTGRRRSLIVDENITCYSFLLFN